VAALVLGQLFFAESSQFVGTLAAFGTLGVGFFARPVGGVLFGHFGDRLGRKTMLVLSLLIMGLATVAIGLLPTYATVGILAPILLVLLRLLQGIAVGGEWGGAVLMAVEHAPAGRRDFYGTWPQMGAPAGAVLANAAFLPFATLPEAQLLSWGWRVPFLLSIVLVGVGLFIRLAIMESPAFQHVRESDTEARIPILDVLRTFPRQVFLAAGTYLVLASFAYICNTYMINYATAVAGIANSLILGVIVIASAAQLVALPFFGALSDRVGRRPLILLGVLGVGITTFLLFPLVETGNLYLMLLGYTISFVVFFCMGYGPLAAMFSEMFGTRVRYSGASLGYQGGTIFGAALAPIIATTLVETTGTALSVSVYVAVMAAISLVCVFLITETYRTDIEELQPENVLQYL
jgi:MHS family shikimate/dehydroshikimate transporter-like MFS transporter